MVRIGLISDTHGLLRPEALSLLAGCDHIIHGGDIGAQDILTQLSQLAPVSAVRGNNDQAPWARALPETKLMKFGAVQLYVIHDLAQIDIEPQALGVAAVISGHSHRPSIRDNDGVLYVNPGSAGPRRFKLPITVAELVIESDTVSARLIELPPPAATVRARRFATRGSRDAS